MGWVLIGNGSLSSGRLVIYKEIKPGLVDKIETAKANSMEE